MELSVVLRDVSGKTGKGNIKIKIKKKGEDPTFIPTTYYIEPTFFVPSKVEAYPLLFNSSGASSFLRSSICSKKQI